MEEESDDGDYSFRNTEQSPLASSRAPTAMWRHRRLLAKYGYLHDKPSPVRQMGSLALLFDAHTVVESILPLFRTLLNDPVASVRNALASQV